MVLNWLHEGKVVDGNTLRPPKSLNLTGSGLMSPPELFRVFRVYSPAAEALRRLLDQPKRRHVVSLTAEKGKKETYEAGRGWMLPAPTGLHFAAQFLFTTDDPEEQSARIRSHRLGSFQLGGEAGSSFKDPTHVVPIGASGKGTISARFLASVDPLLRIQVVTGEHLLGEVFEDAFSDDSFINHKNGQGGFFVGESWSGVRSSSIATYRPPEDWTYAVTPKEFTAEEGSETVVELTIKAPSSGTGLFAFAAMDEDQEQGVVSDILQIQVNESGDLTAKAATDFGQGFNSLTA